MSDELFYTIEMVCGNVESVVCHKTKDEQDGFIWGFNEGSGLFGGDGNAIPLDWVDELDGKNKEYALKLTDELKKELDNEASK